MSPGVDHLHVNGLRNKFCESDESVIASARECLTPMFPKPGPGFEIMPVFSSGQSARQAADTYNALGSTDLIYACGGGIMAHPGGIAAGVRSVRQAWEAAVPACLWLRRREQYPNCSKRWRCSAVNQSSPNRLIAWYGDDFTGSTDALEALASNGLRAVLFLHQPEDGLLLAVQRL